MTEPEKKSLAETDSDVFDAEIRVCSGRISSLVLTCVSAGKRITLYPCAEDVISGGISIRCSLWNGFAKIGRIAIKEL
jgi:hypothetical protein